MTLKNNLPVKTKKRLILKVIATVSLISVLSFAIYLRMYPEVEINWTDGARQSYSYKSRSVLDTFELKQGGRSRVSSYLEGVLHFKIFKVDKKNDTVKTAFKFEPDELKISGVNSEKIKKMYDAIFLVEFSLTGEPRKFSFSRTLAQEDERYLRDFIDSLKFVTAGNAHRTWETDESTATGVLRAEYSSKGNNTFEKHRVYYIDNHSKTETPPSINKSVFKFTLNDSSWVSTVKGYEKTTLGDGSGMRITAYLQNELKLLPQSDSSFFDDQTTYEELSKKYNDTSIIKNSISAWDTVRRDIYADEMKNVTVNSLLGDLRLNKSSPSSIVHSFKNLFSIKPEAIAIAANLVKNGSLPPREYQMIMCAMAQYGSPECQKYLLNFIENRGLPSKLRMDAAIYSGDLNNVSVADAKRLMNISIMSRQEDKGLLSNTILLALGSMCSDGKNNGETADEINRFISNKLTTGTKDTNELAACLAAAGNTHSNVHVKPITEYTKNSSPSIRANAIEALQYIEGEEANKAILSVVERETDTDVLATTLQVQLSRDSNPEITNTVVSRLKNGDDIGTRQPMIEYLTAQDKVDSSTKSVLQDILRTEKNPKIRANINLILNKKDKTKQK